MFPTLRSITVCFSFLFGISFLAQAKAEDFNVQTTPLSFSMQAIVALGSTTATIQEQAVHAIISHPEQYAPPVFYILSDVFAKQKKMEEAAFWFYAGQLRARFDINRSTDQSLGATNFMFIEHYGEPVNQYMFSHSKAKMILMINKVVSFDKATLHAYDPTWVLNDGEGDYHDYKTGKVVTYSMTPKMYWNEILFVACFINGVSQP